ncbi:MAG: hypothetical protein ACLRQ0_14230 [Monoglobales bacterium]
MDPSVLNIGVCALIVGTVAVLSIRHDNMKNRRTKKAIERRRQLEVASIKDGANMVRREYEQEKKRITVVHTQNIICKNPKLVQMLEGENQ